MAVGYGTSVWGIVDIVGSIGGGAAVSVGSFGTLTVGGVAVAVGGVAIGAAQVAYGSAVMIAAIKNFNKDYKQMRSIQKLNLEKVDDGYLKKKGIDAHELKQEIYGKKAKIAEYDIYVDKNTGELYTQRKPQFNKSGDPPISTGIKIK
jgi:hypothetical protein